MKKIVLSLLAVATMFASCSKDDPNSGNLTNPPVKEGIPTYATFELKTDVSAKTRTGNLPEAGDEAAEKNINTVTILIFDELGDQKLVTMQLLASSSSTSGTFKGTLATTSGSKRLFALINANGPEIGGLLSKLSVGSSTLTHFYNQMSDASGALTEMGAEFKEISTSGALYMSNGACEQSKVTLKEGISSTESEHGNSEDVNVFKIIVKRGVAKARLNSLSEEDVSTTDGHYMITIGGDQGLKYGIGNVNRSIFPVQQLQGGDDVKDSDLDATDHDTPPSIISPYYYKFDPIDGSAAEAKTNTNFDQYYIDTELFAKAGVGTASSSYHYLTENSSSVQYVGNSSYYSIEATIASIPGNYIVDSYSLTSGKENILRERGYTVTPATTDFTYTSGATGTENTFYLMRVSPSGITVNGNQKVFTDADVAATGLYYALEALGAIGTANNNDPRINDAVWNWKTGGDTSTELDGIESQFKPNNGGTGGELYFAKDTDFSGAFVELLEGTNGKLDLLNARLTSLLKKELIDVFCVYTDAKCYYRLNITESVNGGTINVVRRNHSYSAKITAFKTIGEPIQGELDKDENLPIDKKKTHVSADIIIQDWHNIEIEGEV